MSVPVKVERRIVEHAGKFRPILEQARARDVNEADTVTIVKGILSSVFGWDPFFEVTSEYAIRSTYCDLAVKTDDQIRYLIEVKAIGGDLRENHLRQAVNYAANHGIEWVVLTNGAVWQAHRVTFGKPIGNELVFDLDFLTGNPKTAEFKQCAFLLSKEGTSKSAIAEYHEERLALSKFNIGAILREEPVLSIVRRELRRAFPALSPTIDQVRALIETEVLKREVVEGEKADGARKAMKRASARALRRSSKSVQQESPASPKPKPLST